MIKIFTTGGTFDKIYFDAKSEFSIGDTMVDPILKEGNVTCEYSVESLLRKDSLEIDETDRQLISDKLAVTKEQQVIITHGTDTMTQTAAAIHESGIKDKTIVLVGAMQPARMRVTDAPFNLGFALAAVQVLSPGIYIAMSGRIFSHDAVTKNYQKGCFESA